MEKVGVDWCLRLIKLFGTCKLLAVWKFYDRGKMLNMVFDSCGLLLLGRQERDDTHHVMCP
jgi:hypothetical protein